MIAEEVPMTHDEMLQALQVDVNAWPERVKDAGVKRSDGAAYVPLPRNNEILRTPTDPEATHAYMIRTWQDPNTEPGSEGWYRIIDQAGPELTWEWLVVDDSRPYAALFPPDIRARVREALGVGAEVEEPSEQDEVGIAARPRRRGRRRTFAEREAIACRAVDVVTELLEREGWSVRDVGTTRSYDLDCSDSEGHRLYVEVKGTTGPLTSVVLTANEVELARRQHPHTALYVVHDIALRGEPQDPRATGGTIYECRPWLPEDSRLTATVFSYRVRDADVPR
jgi:hypothetical protein